MTRRLTALLAALEALLVVAIGVAIPLVPLTIVWAAHFGFGPDWLIFWRAAVDTWLIGLGVDVTFTLDDVTAAALGMTGAAEPVVITIALLGFAVVTLLLGLRAGHRVVDSGHRRLGQLVAIGVFAVASLLVTLTAVHPEARPSIWQGTLLPTLVFALGLVLGAVRADHESNAETRGSRLRVLVQGWSVELRSGAIAALRAGGAAVALTIAASAVAVSAMIAVHYAELIRLYEALHTEVVGGIALTAAQLALLPDLVIWASAWFVGPGFAIGTGSQVSPLGTALGPIPTLPVFGALPTGDHAFGLAGLLVPVVAGFFAGAAVRPALVRALEAVPPLVVAGVAVGGGVAGGLVMGFLAWISAGSAGPGRLVDVGPDPVAVGLAAALEFAIAIGLGLASGAFVPKRRAPRSR